MAAVVTRFLSACGVPIGGGAGVPGNDLLSAEIRDDREKIATGGTTEEVLGNWAVDFDLLDPLIANLRVSMSYFAKQSAGTGTYRIRLGGTYNTADGTLLNTFPDAHAAYPNTPSFGTSAQFARPVGPQLVKLTGARSGAGGQAYIQGIGIVFADL